MITTIEANEYTCEVCTHRWISAPFGEGMTPLRCPSCQAIDWNDRGGSFARWFRVWRADEQARFIAGLQELHQQTLAKTHDEK